MSRRTMPRVILAIVAVGGFAIYELLYFVVTAQLRAIRTGQLPAGSAGPGGPEALTRRLEETLEQLGPSGVPELGVGLVAALGSVSLIVLAASHCGTEFGWGTLRTLLAGGAGRGAFLAAKIATLAVFAALLTLVGAISVTVASFVVAAQAGVSASGFEPGTAFSASWRTLYSFLPYIALAVVIAIWSRSSGAGIAAGLVVYFAEGIVSGLLVQFDPDLAALANAGISRNVSALTSVRVGVSVGGSNVSGAGALPDPLQAALVLAAYTTAFFGLAYWRLRTRDVTLA